MSYRIIGRSVVAAALAATLLPAPAHALYATEPGPRLSPLAYSSLNKPPVTVHVDEPPQVPGGVEESVDPTSPAAPAPEVPVADGSGTDVQHEVEPVLQVSSLSLYADGRNSASFTRFTDGDIIVVTDRSSATGHSGLFDRRYYAGPSSFAFWSANVRPVNGVQREACEKYRAYDRAYGLWVPSEADHRIQARDFAARQVRKPYSVLASKRDWRSFYCSKLAWAAWNSAAGVDLDADGGYWVWPIDLVNSRLTACFGSWT